MSIRSTAKALIVNDGKILLNKCNGGYYSMPGGGQHKYETLCEAVIRECKEETGYEVKPLKLIGLCEEICLDEALREEDPNYTHKIYYIFLCELSEPGAEPQIPMEKDSTQICSEWIDIDKLKTINLLPEALGKQITDVLDGSAPVFLGSEKISFNNK